MMFLPALALAQPSIVSVDPNTAERGTMVTVTITGSETIFEQDTQVTDTVWLQQGGTRIDATTVDVQSPTVLTATFNILSDAPTGAYDVNVEQVGGGGTVTLAGGFTITGPAACSIVDLVAGTQTPCDPGTNTYTQVVTVTYQNPPATGSIVVNGQSFPVGASPQSVTLIDLVANGNPVDVTANFSADPACTRTETALFTAPADCSVVPQCAITDLVAGTQSPCNIETNTYTQGVIVTFENPPASGSLTVNGQTFTIGTSPQTVTLVGLVANGNPVDVTASFSAEPACSRTETALFTAPVSCSQVPQCEITDIAAGKQTACNPATNTYTQSLFVTFVNPPTTGSLVVNGQSFAIGTSPQTVTLTDLVANGNPVDVTANFSAEPGCSRTEQDVFTAPVSCSVTPVCAITDLATGTQTPCVPASNTYTQVVVVTFENPPTTGNLVVNGQSFPIGTSPRSVTLVNLPANGNPVDVTANFSTEPGCSRTEQDLFTAPPSCSVTQLCAITDLAAGTQTPCVPASNTYTQVVIVTFENPPTTGNLVVNGQSFPIGTSPQSVTLENLPANGNPVNVTARFSADSDCNRTENALFTAPVSCGVGQPPDCSDAEPSRKILWPPNHRFRTVRIEDVEDPDGPDREITITITSVTSDEPVDTTARRDTCPDAVINGDGTVDLRAERAGGGNGRVYTINFTATDVQGQTCTGSVFVCVPHDRRDGDDDDDDDDDDVRIPVSTNGDPHAPAGGDRDCDDDATGGGASIAGGDGHGRDRCCDDDDVSWGGNDIAHDDDRRRRGDRCRRCIRDEEQFDATQCGGPILNPIGVSSTAGPLVARPVGGRLAIEFATAAAGPVDVRIYDLRGRLVRQVTSANFPAGRHALQWDGRDASGHEVASGIYFVRGVMAGQLQTSKTVWIR
jgi:hypothetical protein